MVRPHTTIVLLPSSTVNIKDCKRKWKQYFFLKFTSEEKKLSTDLKTKWGWFCHEAHAMRKCGIWNDQPYPKAIYTLINGPVVKALWKNKRRNLTLILHYKSKYMQGNTHQQTKQPPALLLVMYDDPIKQSIKKKNNRKRQTRNQHWKRAFWTQRRQEA